MRFAGTERHAEFQIKNKYQEQDHDAAMQYGFCSQKAFILGITPGLAVVAKWR
jgi:hypothetical protein